MKQSRSKIGLILSALLLLFIITDCAKEYNPMEIKIVDMNHKITSVDKEVAQPGDIVTFTGTDLDQVYKIMLNEDIVPVVFEATATQLEMTIPSLTPLGDVVTINLFFSGKGLAQRTIKIISPPVIMAMSPIAAHEGDVIQVFGRELYLSESITVGGIDATASFNLIDDRQFTVVVPSGFTGGDIVITTETGGESVSPLPLILGTELLVTDIDNDGSILSSYGPYSNASGTTSTDDFPRNGIYIITIEDNGSSWGANCDFYLQNMPSEIGGTTIDLTKVEMVADVKASKIMTINFMVGKNHNPPGLWGKMKEVNQSWQTIIVPFTELGQGYSNDPITDDPLIPFEEYTMIKWSLPAQASAGNFGETITFDNVKFIIRD